MDCRKVYGGLLVESRTSVQWTSMIVGFLVTVTGKYLQYLYYRIGAKAVVHEEKRQVIKQR